jgi:manganese oxidase
MSRPPRLLLAAATFLGLAAAAPVAARMTHHDPASITAGGRDRVYYVSAEEVTWNYAPAGRNLITGRPFDETAATFTAREPGRIGSTYVKCLYRGYTNASFSKLSPQPAHLGFLGPVIRAEVGDTVRVVFRNRCRFPASIHPHQVLYDKSNEGALYEDGTAGAAKADDAVKPGGTFTYRWEVPERAGPGPMDGSSIASMYHGHTDEVPDQYAGLMGPMVITRKGMARADGSPRDIGQELFAMFMVADENQSPYLEQNVRQYAAGADTADPEFEESNLMHSINGYVYGNQPMVTLRQGQRARWYTFGMGSEVDLHTPHWHGATVQVGGMSMDVVDLLPATMATADMTPDTPGTWLFHCHVADHITAGMQTRYTVRGDT